jgi:hypothetical protein
MIDPTIKLAQQRILAKLKADPNALVKVTMRPATARLFVEFLHDFDPDMPPRPICKALGPLVGDVVMNTKLARLDDITDRLGTLMMLMERR